MKLEARTEDEKKLDANLLRIVRANESGGSGQAEIVAKSLDLLRPDSRMKVDVALTGNDKVTAFREALPALHGEIIVSLQNHVFIWLPPASIPALAARTDVFTVATVASSLGQ